MFALVIQLVFESRIKQLYSYVDAIKPDYFNMIKPCTLPMYFSLEVGTISIIPRTRPAQADIITSHKSMSAIQMC